MNFKGKTQSKKKSKKGKDEKSRTKKKIELSDVIINVKDFGGKKQESEEKLTSFS